MGLSALFGKIARHGWSGQEAEKQPEVSKDPTQRDEEQEGGIRIEWAGLATWKRPAISDFRPNDKYHQVKAFEVSEEGQCSVVRSRKTGKVFVVKHTPGTMPPRSIRSERTGYREHLPHEASMLKRAQACPGIIRYFGVEADPLNANRHMTFTELCSGGDLVEQLRTFKRLGIKTPALFTLHVLVSVAQALAYLHHGLPHTGGVTYARMDRHQAIIHGDIKPDNIFLRWPTREYGMPDVVLADFGLAQFASLSRGIVGTPGYDSPEVRDVAQLRKRDRTAYQRTRQQRIMTVKSDVYQLGLVIHLMVTAKMFQVGSDPTNIKLPCQYQEVVGMISILVWLLQVEPAERPECTGKMEDGMLYAISSFRRKRAAVFAAKGPLDEEIWNLTEIRDEPVPKKVRRLYWCRPWGPKPGR